MDTTISVGIDVSKETLMVSCAKPNSRYVTKEFSNSRQGLRSIFSFLKTQGTASAVPCIVESTGDLHLLSSLMLTREGYTVKCINPLITKQYQKASVRNVKCDSVDAERLAFIGHQEPNLPTFVATEAQLEVKKMISTCALLERSIQGISRHIDQLKDTENTMGFGIDLSLAETGLGLLTKQVKELKKGIVCRMRPVSRSISLRGLTLEKMAVVDAFLLGKTFTNRDQLVAFVGLDVCSRRSGNWRGKEKLSKRGNAYFRKTLYHIAWGLSRYEPTYMEYFKKLRERKLHYTTCLMAVARKFLRYVFSVYYGYQQVELAGR